LCDLEHPCQALADILTIKEQFGELKNVKLTYVGDGNNVCHSLMIAAALSGIKFTICCPKGYEPLVEYVNYAAALNKISNGTLIIENNFEKAIKDSYVLYTDVWASMGQEKEKETRMKVFTPYQLDRRCLSLAPNAKIMHCLPAHRGEEIITEILESENSIIFNQAENRRHAQKAVLLFAYNKL